MTEGNIKGTWPVTLAWQDWGVGREPSVSHASWAFDLKASMRKDSALAVSSDQRQRLVVLPSQSTCEGRSAFLSAMRRGASATWMTAVWYLRIHQVEIVPWGWIEKTQRDQTCRKGRGGCWEELVRVRAYVQGRRQLLNITMGDRWWRYVSKIVSLFQDLMKMGLV